MRILSVNKWRYSKDLHTLGAPRGVMLGHEALALQGHQVDYLFIDDVSGGRELRFPHLTFSMLIVPKIMQLTAQHSYDLVEISSGDGWLYGLLRGMIGSNRRPVFVATSAGLEHLVWEEAVKDSELGLQATKGFRARVIRPFVVLKEVEIAIKTSDHFIPVCTEDAEYVIERGWKPESKVTVIPRGIGSEYFVENDDLQRTRGLLFVGTWHPRKGITYIVDAFCVLKEYHPSLQLSLVGTRLSEGEVLQDFPPSIRGDIRVVPLMSPEAVIREYTTHTVFVLPSTKEGLAKVLLEAMAAGMPVVASDRIGKDVIEHEVNGLLVPTRNSQALVEAVERLITDRRFCQELGERAQAKAKEYTWDKIAARYESLYERLLEDCQR